jgi:signal transduction histidine kinase
MVAGIAHELNTPIGNSLMAASTLNDHNRSFDKELAAGPLRRSTLDRFVADNRVATEILLRNLGRAGELITSFKQVAVDQTSSQRRNFTVNEIVDEILMTLNPTLKKTPYMVDTDITPDLWMDSFPGPLGQVLTNLINNALTHAFDGRQYGVIGIKAVWTGDKSRIVITLTDNGKGIPPANITRVFDPFFTTKLGRGGSGLGLNIVHNLVTGILGGHIDVASVEHEQTRFSIELPVKAPIVVGAE